MMTSGIADQPRNLGNPGKINKSKFGTRNCLPRQPWILVLYLTTVVGLIISSSAVQGASQPTPWAKGLYHGGGHDFQAHSPTSRFGHCPGPGGALARRGAAY